VAQCAIETAIHKAVQRLKWGNEVQDALKKLEKLSHIETDMIPIQTLGVVDRLARDARVIMKGVQTFA
jgi:hypothetical protein